MNCPKEESRNIQTHLSDLTLLGKLFAFVIGPILFLATAFAFLFLLTIPVAIGASLLGLSDDQPTTATTLVMLGACWAATYFVVSPVSTKISVWFERLGYPLVDRDAKADRISRQDGG